MNVEPAKPWRLGSLTLALALTCAGVVAVAVMGLYGAAKNKWWAGPARLHAANWMSAGLCNTHSWRGVSNAGEYVCFCCVCNAACLPERWLV
jgi:hypothetical protein